MLRAWGSLRGFGWALGALATTKKRRSFQLFKENSALKGHWPELLSGRSALNSHKAHGLAWRALPRLAAESLLPRASR